MATAPPADKPIEEARNALLNAFDTVQSMGFRVVLCCGNRLDVEREPTKTRRILPPNSIPASHRSKMDALSGASYWKDKTSYRTNDVVREDNETYTCTTPHTSAQTSRPGKGVSWQLSWSLNT